MPDETVSGQFGLEDGDAWLRRLRGAGERTPQEPIHEYEVLEEVARGGQGVVFRARQPRTKRLVALKRMTAGALASRTGQARFLREIETTSTLNHPNLVTVYGAEVVDGAITLAMEWIDGPPIDRWAQTPEPKLLRDVLVAFLKACEAVRHAHQRGVIHRDLKPSNILVDQRNEPRVLDFGLAKVLGETDRPQAALTLTEDFVGTPAYAAPEQIEGRNDAIDVRTDVYALGVVLYQLLTGRLPHDVTQNLADLYQAIRFADVSRPSLHNQALNRELDAIALKALSKDPEERYPSVEAFIADIRRYLSGDTVLAHPPSAAYRLKKLVRRNKLGSAFIVLLIASAITSTALFLSAKTQRRRAENSALQAREQTDKVLAINAFLRDMLSSANPERTLGRELTVREMLDEAAAEIDAGALRDRPAIEAGVRSTIGQTYMALAQYDQAERFLRVAHETMMQTAGPDDPETRRTLSDLGTLAFKRGDLKTAEDRLRTALSAVESDPDGSPFDVAKARNNLGLVLHAAGRSSEAAQLFRAALSIYRSAPRSSKIEAAKTMDNLAQTLVAVGELDEAEALYETAAELARREWVYEHPRRATILHNYAWLLLSKGNLDAAEALFRELLPVFERVYDRGHPELIAATNSLASVLHRKRDYPEAEKHYRHALDEARRFLPEKHPTLAVCLNSLANLLSEQGRLDDAEPFYLEVLAVRRKTLDAGHPDLAGALYDVGWFHCDRDRPAAAIPLFREAVEIWRAQAPDREIDLAACLAAAGHALLRTDSPDQAETVLRECLAIRERALPDSWLTFSTLSELGEALAEQGQIAQAREAIRKALEGLAADTSTPPAILDRTKKRLEWLNTLGRLHLAGDSVLFNA